MNTNENASPDGHSSGEVNPLTDVAALRAGYDSVNGDGRVTSAVTGRTVERGGISESRIRVCLDVEQVCQALGISWSLGASIPGVGGASRKSKFVNSIKITTYSLTIVVYSQHVQNTETLADARLSPGVEPPQGDEALRRFFQAYGDSFITSLTTGSEYYAAYVLHAQTKEQQRGLEAGLQAEGIYNGVKFEAELQGKLDKCIQSVNVNVTFDQQVAGIANPSLPTPKTMIQYAIDFPSLAVTAPVVLGYEYDGYEHLPEITTSFEPIAKNRRYFIGDKAVGGLTAKEAQVQGLDNQLLWLQETYKFYGGYVDPNVDRVKAMSGKELSAIHAQKSAYAQDPIQSFTEPALPSLNEGTPELSLVGGASEQKGSTGGNPYDDVPSPLDNVQKRTRITQITMRMGDRVDKLTTAYLDQNGETKKEHGGTGGKEDRSIRVEAGQFVVRVTGKYNKKMDKMTFFLSNGQSVTAGGTSGDKEFDLAPPSGNFVLGFRGRSGSEYDAIQLVYAHFNPAKWSR
ncbi:jacalin-like lectin [Nannocystis pusilla]|uniref:jacalin-like lectin n=1 Tax=Nannocystis pusilla TaxID=889268 RepID=UPI003BEF87E4